MKVKDPKANELRLKLKREKKGMSKWYEWIERKPVSKFCWVLIFQQVGEVQES